MDTHPVRCYYGHKNDHAHEGDHTRMYGFVDEPKSYGEKGEEPAQRYTRVHPPFIHGVPVEKGRVFLGPIVTCLIFIMILSTNTVVYLPIK